MEDETSPTDRRSMLWSMKHCISPILRLLNQPCPLRSCQSQVVGRAEVIDRKHELVWTTDLIDFGLKQRVRWRNGCQPGYSRYTEGRNGCTVGVPSQPIVSTE